MEHSLTKKFLSGYINIVEILLPFSSGYPEEFVFSALLNQKIFKPFQANVSGGQLDWEALSERYAFEFSFGPTWFVPHYFPSSGDIPAFFYLRTHK